MPSQSWISATAEQREELQALAHSSDREEADRARAILLSLEGWTSKQIAAAFGVRTALRQAQERAALAMDFWPQGSCGIARPKAPGPAATKEQAALSVLEQLLAPEVADRPNWTLPCLQDEIERRTGERLSKSRLSLVLKKGVRLASAPPHAERTAGCRCG
ncbi:MAG TPA: helix-turn-helix domain-containing protein [Stellaceae bacterium]|nr:helix-turn-helix domain-containing protein [Stellaceae bacterium]